MFRISTMVGLCGIGYLAVTLWLGAVFWFLLGLAVAGVWVILLCLVSRFEYQYLHSQAQDRVDDT